MLLQKTSSRIKQFIGHRRKSSYGDSSESYSDDRSSEERIPSITYRRLSWLSQSTPVALILQRFNDGASMPGRRTTPEAVTARSSLSSLCSCECDTIDATSITALPKENASPVGSSALYSEQQRTIPYTISETEVLRQMTLGKVVLSSPKASSPTKPRKRSSLKENMRSPTSNLIEALAIDPVEQDTTPRQSFPSGESPKFRPFSDNVEHLIRETDEAFRTVGTGWEYTKFSVSGWYDQSAPRINTHAVIPASNPGGKGPCPPTPPKPPFLRSIAVPKVKQKSTSKTRTLPRLVSRPLPPPPVNTPGRWTFGDITATMADALNRNIFRTEVNDMLVSERTHQLRGRLSIDTDMVPSRDSPLRGSDTEGSTPKEPFHLEYLSACLTSASESTSTTTSPTLIPSVSPDSIQAPPPNITTKFKDVQLIQPPDDVNSDMSFKDLNFPSPPRTSPSSWTTQPRSPTNFLPTIPEISPLTHILPRFYDRRAVRRRYGGRVFSLLSPNYVFLHSTAYTQIAPLYRHGMIRVERRLRSRKGSGSGSGSGADQGGKLDWTAFRMAVSGTLDERAYGEMSGIEGMIADQEVDLTDLRKWLDEMGLEFVGGVDYGFEADNI